MPEASIHENRYLASRIRDVRPTRHFLPVETISRVAHFAQKLTNCLLWFGVSAFVSLHDL